MKMEYRKISELRNWDKNPRSIKKDDFERLKTHIRDHGQMQPLVVTPDGEVLGGNMRLRAYNELGIEDIWVHEVTPKDEAEKLRIALVLNDRAGFYDSDLLANLIPEYPDFNWEDYTVDLKAPQNLGELIDSFKVVEEDEVPEASSEPAISKLGEVYQLGRHRLMCGDATKIEDGEHLMNGQKADIVFTDPPYGINVVGSDNRIGGGGNGYEARKYNPVIGDNETPNVNFLLDLAPSVLIWGGNYFADKLPQGKKWLVWDKRDNHGGLSFSDCELIWTNLPGVSVKKYVCLYDGYRREGESQDDKHHPTQKAIKVIADILKDHSEENNIILDLYGGSGATLIACEKTNRTCFMSEIDPSYCDVIRKRYAKFIGKEEEWQKLTGQN